MTVTQYCIHLWKKKYIVPALIAMALFVVPSNAYANIIDGFNLAPFVPMVLDTVMAIATTGYEFFVGNGTGIIYILIWLFLALTLSLYAVKLFLPKLWVNLFGFNGGGSLGEGNTSGADIATNVAKPCIRALIATVVLLQIKPIYVTEWVLNPFLEFGSFYTQHIITSTTGVTADPDIKCPEDVTQAAWISERSCNFLIQPVDIITRANNSMIKQGFKKLADGMRGLVVLIPHGGRDFMNVATGLIMIFTFVSCNLFMALLIIQAIFDLGIALFLYPFKVLTWVAAPKNKDKWVDLWPAFDDIIDALKKLVIAMIACAFILCINIAVVNAMFHTYNTTFVAAANGVAATNTPVASNSGAGFGESSITWLSCILTLFLMIHIFNVTRKQLQEITGTSNTLYNNVTSNAKYLFKKTTDGIRKRFGENK